MKTKSKNSVKTKSKNSVQKKTASKKKSLKITVGKGRTAKLTGNRKALDAFAKMMGL